MKNIVGTTADRARLLSGVDKVLDNGFLNPKYGMVLRAKIKWSIWAAVAVVLSLGSVSSVICHPAGEPCGASYYACGPESPNV